MSKKSKQAKMQKDEYQKAVEELGSIRCSLDDAYTRFDSITDPYIMDACIFEISALKSRYDCAVRNIKSLYL
ncbi:MAG TPA: hypothetical protein DD735_09160 [Clostridiales bacterium]|nr:hypothetical protein [Clostridiales bacterium]